MSIATLILGQSGTGKTAALRNLDPASTLLIQAIKKPLSFKKQGWAYLSKALPQGNMIVCDEAARIIDLMSRTKRDVIILDDFQYIMANEFMRRSDEKGYDKFTDIGRSAWDIFNAAASLDDHKRVYILAHTQTDELGATRLKTIGKMLDDKITPEGMFTIVMKTVVEGGQYSFTTRNNGSDTVKTPIGMFESDRVENDLAAVDAVICEYFEIQSNSQDQQ